MANQISTITIPCLVIALNNTEFYDNTGYGSLGRVLQVQCRDVFYDNTDAWAIPQTDGGIFTGFTFIHKAGDFVNQPTYDSFTVFRIRDKFSDSWWWIYGTQQDFLASCATCCGEGAVPMPGVSGVDIAIAPCNELCDAIDDDGNFFETVGLPTLGAGQTYFPFGSYNNIAFPDADAGGYATPTLLLNFLNSDWDSAGSPAIDVTWVNNGNGTFTATFTNGELLDNFCVLIVPITP